MRRGVLLGVGFVLLAGGIRADGAFVAYTDRAAFLAAAGDVTTETFDEFGGFTVLGPVATVAGVTYHAPRAGTVSVQPSDLASSPPNVLGLTSNDLVSRSGIEFGGGSVTALGMTFGVPSGAPASVLSFFVYEPSGNVLTFNAALSPGLNFVGFIDPSGIAEVTFPDEATAGGLPAAGYGVDDVSRSATITPGNFVFVSPDPVPGPASILMLGAGLAGVGAWLRRASGRATPPSPRPTRRPPSSALRPGLAGGGSA